MRVVGLIGEQDGRTVTLTDAALATFPAPILIADAACQMSAANVLAEALCRTIGDGHVPGITTVVTRALTTKQSQVEVVVVPGPAGSLLYEISVLPLDNGTAFVMAKDVTLESNLRSALVESRQRYKDLVEISSDFA